MGFLTRRVRLRTAAKGVPNAKTVPGSSDAPRDSGVSARGAVWECRRVGAAHGDHSGRPGGAAAEGETSEAPRRRLHAIVARLLLDGRLAGGRAARSLRGRLPAVPEKPATRLAHAPAG